MKIKKAVSLLLTVVMVLSLFSVFVTAGASGSDGCYIRNTMASMVTAPVRDGVISEGEYGEPIIVTSQTDSATTWVKQTNANETTDQRAKVYMTNDDKYLYLAATLDHAVANQNPNTKNGQGALFCVTLSKYNKNNKVYQENGRDQYLVARLSFDKTNTLQYYFVTCTDKEDGSGTDRPSAAGVGGKGVFNTDTYTYEMRIPWSAVPGMTAEDVKAGTPVAATMRISDGNRGTKESHASSYYLIGGDAVANFSVADAHADGVLAITPSDWCRIGDTFTALTETPKMDNTVSEGEYGEPVIVASPDHAGFTLGKNDTKRPNQRATVYMGYTDEFLYVAATLSDAVQNSNANTQNNLAAMFSLTLSKYDEQTKVLQENGNDKYFVGRFSFNNKNEFSVWSQIYTGSSRTASDAIGAKGAYKDGTYIYEARIPWSSIPGVTADDVKNGVPLATTVRINDGNVGSSSTHEGGCYLFGGDGAKTYGVANPHSDGVLALTLTENGCIKNAIEELTTTPQMDNVVSEGEYGDPVILAAPADSAFTLGNGAVKRYNQRAKVYMTYNEKYLYVAATLSDAVQNTNANTQNNLAAMFSLTLSKYDPAYRVLQDNGNDKYFVGRFSFNSKNEFSVWSQIYTGSSRAASDAVGAKGEYKDGTYTYEARIPWTSIPGVTAEDIANGVPFAATVRINDGNVGSTSKHEGSYYLFGGDAVKTYGEANPHSDGVLKLTPVGKGYRSNVVTELTTAPKMDNVVAEGEYGNPIIFVTPEDEAFTLGNDDEKRLSQRAKVYMGYTDDYLYVAATLSDAVQNTNAKTMNNLAAMLSLTLSKYDEEGKVLQEDGKDKYFVGRFSFNNKNEFSVWSQIYTGSSRTASDAIGAKGAYKDGTYIYEARIPWTSIPGMTADDMKNGVPLAATIRLNDGNVGSEATHEGGCYLFGGDGAKTYGEANPHSDGVLKLTSLDACYVKDAVSPFNAKPTIDGNISNAEWGDPIIITRPDHCNATWAKSFWGSNDPTHVNANQTVRVYSTNDDEYVYFGVTINEADLCTLDGKMYEKAHLFLTIGRHDNKTDMERILSLNKTYERCVVYRLGFDGSTPTATATGIKVDRVSIGEDDWAIRYDAQARTYTYELRIPFTMTTLRYGNDNKMNVSIAVADARHSMDTIANVYNIGGTGASYVSAKANNFAHTGQSMMLKLNDNPYAKSDNWTPVTEINPVTGDLSVWPIVVAFVAGGCIGVCLICKRRKINE